MSAPFAHLELNTSDVSKAKAFYKDLFQWEMDDLPNDKVPGMEYTMIKTAKGPGGGIMKNPMPGVPSFWLTYVEVEDIHASTKKAASLGAQVMKEPMEVMDAGWISILVDPTGAAIGLWQGKAK
ncbi:MAG: VOC family protein [Acidobacteriota bacterium]